MISWEVAEAKKAAKVLGRSTSNVVLLFASIIPRI